jgi:hypothetical protein
MRGWEVARIGGFHGELLALSRVEGSNHDKLTTGAEKLRTEGLLDSSFSKKSGTLPIFISKPYYCRIQKIAALPRTSLIIKHAT